MKKLKTPTCVTGQARGGRRLRRVVLLLGASAAFLFGADPFVGSWKFNPRKSKVDNPDNFKDRKQVFESLEPDSWRFTESGWYNGSERTETNTIVLDGREHTLSDGTVATYKRVDARRVTAIRRTNGHSQTIDARVSSDGKTLTLRVKGDNLRTGKPLDQVEVYDRE